MSEAVPLLAVDATQSRCAVVVRAALDGVADVVEEEILQRGHDARLAPMAMHALARAGITPRDLARVAAATGPGSFTGVRLGVAFARGLALALDVPAVGVSNLDALAYSVARAGLLAVVHDAKRGDVVWRAFRAGRPLGAPTLATLAEATATIEALRGPEAAGLVGSGAALIAGDGRVDLERTMFDMRALGDLAAQADPALAPAEPFYHRPPDAEPAANRANRSGGGA